MFMVMTSISRRLRLIDSIKITDIASLLVSQLQGIGAITQSDRMEGVALRRRLGNITGAVEEFVEIVGCIGLYRPEVQSPIKVGEQSCTILIAAVNPG